MLQTMTSFVHAAALLIALAACEVEAAEPHVVMILIDGLPADMLDDPRASLPVIRGLAREGVAAVGGMRVSDPSITWPDPTSLDNREPHPGIDTASSSTGTGAAPEPGELVEYFASRTQQELVRVPLLFDVLKQAGQNSAAINWPCTRGSTSIDDNFPDVPGALAYTTQRLKDELARKGLLQRFQGGNDVVQDEIWTEAACEVIRDRMPRFLALHLNNVDSAHHQYGPRSNPGYAAVALNDANVGRILTALDQAGVRGRTSVFIVADHGFIATPKSIRPNAVLRREGLLKVEKGQIVSGKVLTISLGGSAMGYLTNPTTASSGSRGGRPALSGSGGDRTHRRAEGLSAVPSASTGRQPSHGRLRPGGQGRVCVQSGRDGR